VLVYNASGFKRGNVLDITVEDFENAWKITARGAFVSAKEVLAHMVEQGKGTIIFTGATASLRGGALFPAFASSKFALRALAQSIAREFGPKGVHTAHVIIDGGVDTQHTGKPTLISPDAIADTYWHLHFQHNTSWTQELELRPSVEKW
jgi:NAD(P)-dependent dehydrogenase (short-subunit alcohol dehydrogenase family)